MFKSWFTGLIIACAFFVSGCSIKDGQVVGDRTGINYTIAYKVVAKGVETFMTQEQIEKAKLDKIDIVVTDTTKLIVGKESVQ